MINEQIVLNRGEDRTIQFAFFTQDDQPLDLTGSDIEMRLFSINNTMQTVRSPDVNLLNANTVSVHFSHDEKYEKSNLFRYEIFSIKFDTHTLLTSGKIRVIGGKYE